MSTDVADIFIAREAPASIKTEHWSRTHQLMLFVAVGTASALCATPWLLSVRYPHLLLVAMFIPPLLPIWAGVLSTAPRHWHISIIAGLLGRLAITSSISSPRVCAMWCVVSAIEVVLTGLAVRALSTRDPPLPTLQNATLYLAIFGTVSLISSTLMGWLLNYSIWSIWRARVATEVFGAMTLLPAVLTFIKFTARRAAIDWSQVLELLLILTVTFTLEYHIGQLSGDNALPLLLLAPVPVLLWAALRVGPSMVGFVMFVIAAHRILNLDLGLDISRLDAVDHISTVLLYVTATALPQILLSVTLLERRNAQAALRRSHNRYELATNAAAVYVWEWDLRTDEIQIDPSFTQRLGFRCDEVGGSSVNWRALCHGNDGYEIVERLRAFQASGNSVFEVTYRMRDRDGNIHWFNSRGRATEWENDQPVRLVGSVIDVTDQKRTQETLRQTRGALANFRRVSELSEVAAGIAHEVNQPLCAMMTNAAACQRWLAAGHAQDAPFMQEALANIIDNGNRAAGIIERTRDMFRSEMAGHSVQSLNDIVKTTLQITGPRIRDARVVVETSLDTSNPQARGDGIQLQQVFHNFVLNALEAMSVNPHRERRLQISSCRETTGEVCIAFHDTGAGLESTDIDQLCRPFYTTKATGTGMGLAIVRTIVKSHGGRLRVRSNAAGGATFEVVLPTV